MVAFAAAILAGGRGERLGGVNKALIRIGGMLLLDRVVDAVAGANPVLLCVGDNAFPAECVARVSRQVADLPTGYGGPLAGVAAAVDALTGEPIEYLLTVAVDTPFFPADFHSQARPLLQTSPAAIARYGDQDYPTNGVWRLSALRDLPLQVRDGVAPHSLKRLAASLGAVALDYTGEPGGNPFANINTPADLAEMEARFRSAMGSSSTS